MFLGFADDVLDIRCVTSDENNASLLAQGRWVSKGVGGCRSLQVSSPSAEPRSKKRRVVVVALVRG